MLPTLVVISEVGGWLPAYYRTPITWRPTTNYITIRKPAFIRTSAHTTRGCRQTVRERSHTTDFYQRYLLLPLSEWLHHEKSLQAELHTFTVGTRVDHQHLELFVYQGLTLSEPQMKTRSTEPWPRPYHSYHDSLLGLLRSTQKLMLWRRLHLRELQMFKTLSIFHVTTSGQSSDESSHWAISHSSQCSTTGVTKAVVCAILSMGWCI